MNIKKRFPNKISKSTKGQMPFALIAVAILLLSSAYCVVTSQIEEVNENTDNIEVELESVGSVMDKTKSFVERGLGEIILDISTDENETMSERVDKFETRSKDWIEFQFPINDRGVDVTLQSFNISLVAESLKLSDKDIISEGYAPSYLKGVGDFTAIYESGSGISERTINIEADSSCALPLIAEQGSLFENAISDSGSLLSQMMTYQLTALAQYRVLNGYGALSEFGDMGTASIITEEDVEKSYRNSVTVLETLFFRNNSENVDIGATIDLADGIIAEDGYIKINLSAVYSQSLISIMDDIILQWSDYFYGNKIINAVDNVSDVFMNAIDSIVGFFSQENNFSAAPYIESVMNTQGYSSSDYRYLMSGKTFSISVPQSSVSLNNDENVLVDKMTINVPYPEVDLMSWHNIDTFKKTYREDTNALRDWLGNIINSAAVSIGANKSLGTIKIDIDSNDNETFLQSLTRGVTTAVGNNEQSFETSMINAINEQSIVDPFYASIYEVIEEDRYEIFKLNLLRESIEKALIEKLSKEYGDVLSSGDFSSLVASMMESSQIDNIINKYKSSIDSCVSNFEALNNVSGGQDGVLKKICIAIFKECALLTDSLVDVPKRIVSICEEVTDNIEMNAYAGITTLPDSDCFTFTDNDGGVVKEYLSVSDELSPTISVNGPNDNLSDCMHYVGFNDESGASYATVFSISLKDDLKYSVQSAGPLSSAMGMSHSKMNGSTQVDLTLKIVVASGWGLSGVKDYNASNTILSDAWNALISLLSPLLEPLRDIMSLIMNTLEVLGSALMDIARYAASVVEKLYNALIEPLERIKNFIEDKLSGFVSSALEYAVDAVKMLIDINASNQTVGFSFLGFELSFSTDALSWVKNTKHLLTVSLEGSLNNLELKGSIIIKQKGSDSSKETIITGAASIKGNDWNLAIEIDPFMKASDQIVYLNGVVKGMKIDIVLPKLIQYQTVDFKLSDVSSIAAILSNIPLPIPGLKGSIDAGIELKFNAPFKNGLLINEFELNPEGQDAHNEWVEIFNSTRTSIDITGYTLHAGSDEKDKTHTIPNMHVSPGGRVLIYFPGSFLNNNGSSANSNGEHIILKDKEGKEIDKSPVKKDNENNSKTWQRITDGASEWAFADGTPDYKNSVGNYNGTIMKNEIIDILTDSAEKTFSKMKELKDVNDLSEFFELMINDTVNTGIDKISSILVEASIFVTLEINDSTSTTCVGLRVDLSIGSEFVKQGLQYLVNQVDSMFLNLINPYGLNLKNVITDNAYLGVTVYAGLDTPFFLQDVEAYPNVRLGISIDTNISGLCTVLQQDTGTWTVNAGIVIFDCPSLILPSSMDADPNLDSDLWIIHGTIQKIKA